MIAFDQTKKEDILNDLCCDYETKVNTFVNNYGKELNTFSERISSCYKLLKIFDNISEPTNILAYTRGYSFYAIDSLYTSVKLLILGYFMPSGNMFRHSMESCCMSILLTSKEDILTKNNERINFLNEYLKDNYNSFAHNSIDLVNKNSAVLGIKQAAIDEFYIAKKLFNNLSHASKVVMSMRVLGKDGGRSFEGTIEEDSSIYPEHLNSRINYASILPDLIENIYDRARAY